MYSTEIELAKRSDLAARHREHSRWGGQRGRTYVVGIDGGPTSTEVIAYLNAITEPGDHVELVQVLPRFDDALVGGAADKIKMQMERDASAVLSDASSRAMQAGASVTSCIRFGRPADEILTRADELEADCVVIGKSNHGRRSMRSGSRTTDTVVSHARRPVMVVT